VGDPDLNVRAGRRGTAGPGPILLNARVLTRPTITGVERWAAEVFPRLRALDPARYRTVTPRPRLTRRELAQSWEQAALPALAAAARASTVLSPANLAPLAWPRNVVVMHDAAVLREPDAYSRAYRIWHRSFGLAAARRATRVITVSEFSRRELVALAGLDPERVTVVPNGVDGRFSPAAVADAGRVAARLALHRPYVLTIATADRRKNLASLAPAAQRLAASGIELVWAGDDRPYFARADATTGIRSVGYVDDSDLPGLYAGARAFVAPSRYEGFGLTCVEAMACGTPVVAADRAALPETCAGAAVLVDPGDPGAIAAALERAVADEELRAHLRAAGRARAAQLTWDATARATHALLGAVTGG
jgi:glycosyltransferase involved in cell wall biosynthesis